MGGWGCTQARDLFPSEPVSFDYVAHYYNLCDLSKLNDWSPYVNIGPIDLDDPRRIHEMTNIFVATLTLFHAIRSGNGLKYWVREHLVPLTMAEIRKKP
jgi:hypothetical protein